MPGTAAIREKQGFLQDVKEGAKGVFYNAPTVVDSLPVMKNLAQSLLGVVWFIQGLPHIVKLIPTKVDGVIASLEWVKVLKPFEKALMVIKHLGNTFELPGKLVALKKVPEELKGGTALTNRWKGIYRITSTFYIGLDAIVLIPLKYNLWNLLAIGGWAAKVGVTSFGLGVVRDAFTAGSSVINVVAEGKNIKKAEAVIKKCSKRLDVNGPLAQIRDLLAKNTTWTPDALKRIDELKSQYRDTKFGNEDKKDKAKIEAQLVTDIDKAKKTLADLRDKKLKAEAVNLEKQIPPVLAKLAAMDQDIQKAEKILSAKLEKLERMKVRREDTTEANLDRLRQVVVYKTSKNEIVTAEKRMTIEKLSVTRWYDVFKCAVVVFTNMLVLGVAFVVAPPLGLSAATVAAIFLIGQWTTGISCGLAGLGRVFATFRYDQATKQGMYALPKTSLLLRA